MVNVAATSAKTPVRPSFTASRVKGSSSESAALPFSVGEFRPARLGQEEAAAVGERSREQALHLLRRHPELRVSLKSGARHLHRNDLMLRVPPAAPQQGAADKHHEDGERA